MPNLLIEEERWLDRHERDAKRHRLKRANETPEQRERRLQYVRDWRVKNRERFYASIVRWQREHPEAVKRAQGRSRRKASKTLSTAYLLKTMNFRLRYQGAERTLKRNEVPAELLEAEAASIRLHRRLAKTRKRLGPVHSHHEKPETHKERTNQ